jgi:hypothetical protein
MPDANLEKTRRDRRLAYRHPCGWNCGASMTFVLRDLSIGGASLETQLHLPLGTRMNICVLDNDPELKVVPAVVLSCESREKFFIAHVQFDGRTLNRDRALNKYLLRLQTRRVF